MIAVDSRTRRTLGVVLFFALAFSQGCYSRQLVSVGALDAPARLRLTHPGGILVHRLPAESDVGVLPPCHVTRIEGTLVRFRGDTLVFREAAFGSVVAGAPRCFGNASTVYVIPADHPALRMEAVRFDPLGSLMTAIILAPIIAFGVVAVYCAMTPCMG